MITPSGRAAGVRHFLAMEIFERAKALEAGGADVIHLEVGEPDFASPTVALEAAATAIGLGHTKYTPSLGIPELRSAIAGRISGEYSTTVDPERVVITMGSSAALLLTFATLLDPGDELIVPDPGYPCYPNIAASLGIAAVPVPVRPERGFVYDPAEVNAAMTPRTKAIVVCSPSNPTGTITPASAYERLGGLGPVVISDEVYAGLVYEGEHASAVKLENAVVLGGFSKRYSMTGWRLGWAIVPPELVRTIQALQQNLFVSPADFVQHAAVAALGAQDDLDRMRRAFDERRIEMIDLVERAGLGVPARPQGAFYVFADASRFTNDSLAFAKDILETTHVAVTPGIDFGARGEGFLRFSYTNSLERIREGLHRVAEYLSTR